MTAYDLLIMLEVIDEDIDQNNMAVSLSGFVRKGKFKYRPFQRFEPTKAGAQPGMYLRCSK